MKKIVKTKLKMIAKRVSVLVGVIIMLVFLPVVGLAKNNNLELIYEKFVGVKSEYQGMIEIWNVDTFEGGLISKTKMLQQVANKFKAENKGLYFMIRNISESECKNLLDSGQRPDLFSASYGVAEMLKNEVSAFEKNDNICDVFLSAGKDEMGKQKAIAWCANAYCLMTTHSLLEKVGKDAKHRLVNIALDCGYKVNTKKGEKVVWSLEFGSGKYLMPQNALFEYYKQGEVVLSDTSVNQLSVSQSSYSAYCNFVAGKSSVLLGTLRDAYRLKNREKQGKVDGVIVEPLAKMTDLVQFMFKVDDGNKTKQKYVDGFVEYLTGVAGQQVVCDGGLLPVLKYTQGLKIDGVMKDIPLENIKSYEVFGVFLSKTEIEKLQQKYFKN